MKNHHSLLISADNTSILLRYTMKTYARHGCREVPDVELQAIELDGENLQMGYLVCMKVLYKVGLINGLRLL